MNIKITDHRIQQVIRNISEDFRFSSKHEKYAHFFYDVECEYELDKNKYSGMLEYILIAQKKMQDDIAWKQKILSEDIEIEEQKLLNTMKLMEQEYQDLFSYLHSTSFHTF